MGEEKKKDDVVELTKEEKIRMDRGFKAKEFFQCEFFLKYLLPFIDKERIAEYPKPDHENWEEEYRLAYAKDAVYVKMMEDIQAWVREYEALKSKEGKPIKDIMTA